MNLSVNYDAMEEAMSAAEREYTVACKLLDRLDSVMSLSQIESRTALEHSFLTDAIDDVNELSGCEVLSLEAFNLDKAKKMARKVHRAIADFIAKIINVIKGFFASSRDKTEEQTQRLKSLYEEFQEAMVKSDQVIKDLSLTPGQKPSKEDLENINQMEAEVFFTHDGKIADSTMIKADLTILIAKKRRNDPRFAYLSDEKGNVSNLALTIDQAIQSMETLLSVGHNVAFYEFGNRLYNIRNKDDVEWLRTEGIAQCHDFVIDTIQRAKLRVVKGTRIYQARPFMNRWYPSFSKKSMEGAEYMSFTLSASAGRLDKSPQGISRFKHDKVTMSDLERLLELRSALDAFIISTHSAAEKGMEQYSQFAEKDGKIILEAQEKMASVINPEDQHIIKKLDYQIRNYPKAANECNSLFVNIGRAATELTNHLGYYIDAMLSIKEMPE
ncbi:hypothetical protein [Vibrio phage BONAISHI]|nr:hypothetical protein [Vibrio phage BONAISHI]